MFGGTKMKKKNQIRNRHEKTIYANHETLFELVQKKSSAKQNSLWALQSWTGYLGLNMDCMRVYVGTGGEMY